MHETREDGGTEEGKEGARVGTRMRTARARDVGACGHRHARRIRGEGHILDKVVSARSV